MHPVHTSLVSCSIVRCRALSNTKGENGGIDITTNLTVYKVP